MFKAGAITLLHPFINITQAGSTLWPSSGTHFAQRKLTGDFKSISLK